jgi:hypothetical protein
MWKESLSPESGSPPFGPVYFGVFAATFLDVKWSGRPFAMAFFWEGVTGRVTSGLGAGNEPFFDLTVFCGLAGFVTATSRGGTLT